jgi:hypothetical protein
MTGAELLRSLGAEADRITALDAGLRDRIDTLTDPTAAEAEVEAVRAAADQRATTAEKDRDEAVRQARAEADERVGAAVAERDAARQAQQETARVQAAARAAQAETERVRADAEKMLDQVRADAARERDELRADLRARAERAEQQADAYRDELGRLRPTSSGDGTGTQPAKTARRVARVPAT